MDEVKKIETYTTKGRLKGIIGALLAIAAIFFIVPVFEKNFYTHLFLQCSIIVLIVSTVYTIDREHNVLIAGLFFLLPFIYFDSLSFLYSSTTHLVIAYSYFSIFTILAIIILMRKILHARFVNADLIFGALMVYLLSGALWANFYFVENIIFPQSFHGAGLFDFDSTTFLSSYEKQFNFLYYSFATLATLGMGDITPLSHLAKSLTTMEAMFGQLLLLLNSLVFGGMFLIKHNEKLIITHL